MRQFFTLVGLFIAGLAFGQQQATFSQYMFNGLAINPAFAGSDGVLTATALARYQSLGLEGAPNTQSFAVHAPLLNKSVGVGFLVVRDNISIINQYSVQGAYAYRIKFNELSSLSFGLQMGINSISAEYSQLLSINQNDPAFQGDVRSTRPNFGVGIFYKTNILFAGLSIPQMANNVFTRGPDLSTVQQDNPIILNAGYIWKINRAIHFRPSTLIKFVGGQIVELDINAQISFDDILWVGASATLFNSVDILTQMKLTRQLRFGYSYTITTNELRVVSIGTHEVMISYRFEFPPKDGLISPRYF